MIPITIATKNNKSAASILLDTKTSTVTIDNIDSNDWVKVSFNKDNNTINSYALTG